MSATFSKLENGGKMKTIILIVGIQVVLFSFTFQDSSAQKLGDKVYWMAITEVPLGKLPEYHAWSEKELVPLMEKHGYHFVAGWQTIVGNFEEVISVSEFENMAAYHEARKSLLGSEEWKTVSIKFNTLTRGVRSSFLSSLPYSRMK
jgi:hypothetical protein